MNKNEEDRLVNAIIDLHQEIKGLRSDMDKRLAKINLALGEMRLSYMKLDESFNKLDSSFNNYALRNDERPNKSAWRINQAALILQENPQLNIKERRKNKFCSLIYENYFPR